MKTLPHLKFEIRLSIYIISIFTISSISLEYLLTEWRYLLDSLNRTYLALFFITLILSFTFISNKLTFPRAFKLSTHHNSLLPLALLLTTVITGYWYQSHYSSLQRIPKVKSISKDWTIQADLVIITGRNFGSTIDTGTVYVGDLLFHNISWSNHRVVVEQPVPDEFFTAPMSLTNHRGNSVIVTPNFSIRDPAEVL